MTQQSANFQRVQAELNGCQAQAAKSEQELQALNQRILVIPALQQKSTELEAQLN